MLFTTMGDKSKAAILFFHAMGVTGESSQPVAECLQDNFFCIMPTATVYCQGQKYINKEDELRQIEEFLDKEGIGEIQMVVASSLGADLAMEFLTKSKVPVSYVFFDGGQFAQIPKGIRVILTPILYLAIKSLYWSKGKTLKHILWCDDENIKPYFIQAGKNLTYGNLRRQLGCSVENKPFPHLDEEMQKKTFWEFGSVEDHFKYRENVRKAYPFGNFPVYEGFNHMEFQIKNPKGFAEMLVSIIK